MAEQDAPRIEPGRGRLTYDKSSKTIVSDNAEGSYGYISTDGHGYTGEFTAAEFNERAFDHDKAARNGLAAGPNVSYVRTFQACATALRYAATHMFKPANTEWNEAIEAAANIVEQNRWDERIEAVQQIRSLKK